MNVATYFDLLYIVQSHNDLESQSVSSGGDTRQSVGSAVARSSPSNHDYTLHAYISATGQCQLNRIVGEILLLMSCCCYG